MKRIISLFVFCVLNSLIVKTSAQTHGLDYLGTWCYIDVDLTNDPEVEGYLVYDFPTPPEPILGIYGNGIPLIDNYLGTEKLVLKLRKFDLIAATCGEDMVCGLFLL